MKFFGFQKLGFVVAGIKKIPWVLASNAFLVILILIFFAILWGTFLFFHNNYIVSIKKEEKIIVKQSFKFKKAIYQEILTTWQEREKELEESLQKEYSNPFQ